MFGPAVGPWRRNGFALTMATAMFVGVSGPCAVAQERPEAVIGTFESTNAARAAQGRPATFDFEPSAGGRPASTSPAASPEDDGLSRLFSSALDDLEAGRAPIAQRKLEQVIARDPDGHLAKSARGYLADLYRGTPAAPRAEAAPAAAAQPKFETPRSSLGAGALAKETAAPAAKTVMPPEALGIAVAAVVEEDFIVSAGDRVFFANGSAELGQRARIVLAAQARWLSGHPELKAVIEGHADDGALPADQMAKLSEARALAVRDRLVEEGIDSSRLSVTALGRKAPVADCPGTDCAAQNRRAITVLRTQAREFGQRQRGQSVASESVRAPMP